MPPPTSTTVPVSGQSYSGMPASSSAPVRSRIVRLKRVEISGRPAIQSKYGCPKYAVNAASPVRSVWPASAQAWSSHGL